MPNWFDIETVSLEIGGRQMTIETGRMAKQAAGAAVVTYGETVVLVTATSAKPRQGIDFFPLTVDYVEKTSAAGKIPGGFFKREGRLSDREILACRFIDRSIRPLFADSYRDETQVMATVLSADGETSPHIPAFVGASAALTLSDVPFNGPIAAVHVGRSDGELVVNPLASQMNGSAVDLIVAGSRQALVMVEGAANELPEAEILEALQFAHSSMIPLLDAQEELRSRVGKPKRELPEPEENPELEARVRELAEARLTEALRIPAKLERYAQIAVVEREIHDQLVADFRAEKVAFDSLEAVEARRAELQLLSGRVKSILHDLRSSLVRRRVLDEGLRIDGRGPADVRPIACELSVAPRAFWSARMKTRY